MAEFPDKGFLITEQCSQCGTKPAVFLHHVFHKGQILHVCTSCVLQLHQGSFCPICVTVYDDQFNLSQEHFKCTSCENVFHLSCIQSIPSFSITEQPTGASSSSSSTASQNYCVSCPYCVDPNKKIFEFSRDDTMNAVKIDMSSSPQLLAAAQISIQSMIKAGKIALARAQTIRKEAAEAKKEAKDALKKLDDLILAHDQENKEDKGSKIHPRKMKRVEMTIQIERPLMNLEKIFEIFFVSEFTFKKLWHVIGKFMENPVSLPCSSFLFSDVSFLFDRNQMLIEFQKDFYP